MEQHLNLVARNRKNAHFFKSAVGAAVGDVITSLIATALQRNQDSVKANPELWMPWCFEKNKRHGVVGLIRVFLLFGLLRPKLTLRANYLC